MARPRSKHPTELELAILKIIWRHGPLPVRNVRDGLAVTLRDLAYTSVMTIMNIMVNKGYLSRKKEGPSFVYRARITEAATAKAMLKDLLVRVFDGSPEALVSSLLELSEVKPADVKRIREALVSKPKAKKAKRAKKSTSR